MRVLLDANVYISYLLASKPGGVISSDVEHAILSDDVELFMPERLVTEIVESVSSKPYLRNRIPHSRVESVLGLLASVATTPPSLDTEIRQTVRDAKDDYLVAYGLMINADYLVTGDNNLLVLERIQALEILSPVQLWRVVNATDLDG